MYFLHLKVEHLLTAQEHQQTTKNESAHRRQINGYVNPPLTSVQGGFFLV